MSPAAVPEPDAAAEMSLLLKLPRALAILLGLGALEGLARALVPAGTGGRAAAATSCITTARSVHGAKLFSPKVNLCYSSVWGDADEVFND